LYLTLTTDPDSLSQYLTEPGTLIPPTLPQEDASIQQEQHSATLPTGSGYRGTQSVGERVFGFKISVAGLSWIKKNRLQAIYLAALRAAIDLTKQATITYIGQFWPQKWLKLTDRAIQFLRRNRYYDLSQEFYTEIGSDVEYMKYVVTMASRFTRPIRWTNPGTKTIEKGIVEKTVTYYLDTLKTAIRDELTAVGLGWTVKRGRRPKKPVHPTKPQKLLTQYTGTYNVTRFTTTTRR
jgi:hypothetical protein